MDLQLARLQKLLAEKRLTLELTDAARNFLAERGYDPTYGARPLKRAIQKYMMDPLALKVLSGEFLPGDHIQADADRGRAGVRQGAAGLLAQGAAAEDRVALPLPPGEGWGEGSVPHLKPCAPAAPAVPAARP